MIDGLSSSINDALSLLHERAKIPDRTVSVTSVGLAGIVDQCKAICTRPNAICEPIRTIHHFACTGGTLLSKCIASMPNIRLFSEVDPLSTMTVRGERPLFLPTDMIMQARQSTHATNNNELVQIFHASMKILHENTTNVGRRTIVRDHAHSQFCTDQDFSCRPTLLEMLKSKFSTLSVLTIRDPIDSFISLRRLKWVHFRPDTFDEYCRRYVQFIERHKDIPIIKYENFIDNPAQEMRNICSLLRIPYQDDFENLFSAYILTGDSGRKANHIVSHTRRTPDCHLQREVDESQNYRILLQRMGYSPRQVDSGT